MNTFLTILAALWFILFTCIGNVAILMDMHVGKKVYPKPWTIVVDLIAIAYLISRLIGAL